MTVTLFCPQVSAAVQFVKLTHPHPKVPEYVTVYTRALHAVLGGESLQRQAEIVLKGLGVWDACTNFSRQAAKSVTGNISNSSCRGFRIKV